MAKPRFFPCTLEEDERGKRICFNRVMDPRIQSQSFDRIVSFKRQLVEGPIRIHRKEMMVYLVTTSSLDGRLYLEKLVKRFQPFLSEAIANTVWLDVKNDVFLTLTKIDQQAVDSVFEGVSRR